MPLFCAGLYLVLLFAVGFALLSTIAGASNRHWAFLLGASFAGGMSILSLILFIASLLGSVPGRMILIATGLVTAGCLILLKSKRRLCRIQRRERWAAGTISDRMIGLIAIVLLLSALVNVAATSLTPGLADVDAYAIWMFKAKVLAAQPLRPIPYSLLLPAFSYSHQDYPLSMPLIVAGMYAAVGGVDEQLGKACLLPTFAAAGLVLYAALRDRLSRSKAGLLTGVFLGSGVMVQHAGMAVAEMPLVLQHSICLIFLLRWLQAYRPADLIGCASFAAFAAFTKNEGLALLPLVGLAALSGAIRLRLVKQWVIAAAIALILLLPWLVYRSELPRSHEDYGSKLTSPLAILHAIPRFAKVLGLFASELVDLRTAGCLWLLLIAGAAIGWRAWRCQATIILWALLVAHLALYLLTFLVTPWEPQTLIPMVGPKLLMHAGPLAILLIGLMTRDVIVKGRTTAAILPTPLNLPHGH